VEIFLIVTAFLVFVIIMMYFYVARVWAGNLLVRFLAESIIVKNIHPSKQAQFIVKKSLENIDIVPWVVRKPTKWYIKNRGIDITNSMLHFIILTLKEDQNIEIVQQ
jgi:hypothetical protein